MTKKEKNNYFTMFIEMADNFCKMALELNEILNNFDPARLNEHRSALHAFENIGDGKRHILIRKLAREFITPIEREDIITLAGSIDDIADSIEDIIIGIYMYNIDSITTEAVEFGAIVEQCCRELHMLLTEFANFRKSKIIKDSIIEMNRLEEQGDKLYIEAMHRLYSSKKSPLEIIAWGQLYNIFEKCCDTCEDVADLVENVIMKNT
jgi:uncharacterized protein Yka (UPF0111/DUF47 family)